MTGYIDHSIIIFADCQTPDCHSLQTISQSAIGCRQFHNGHQAADNSKLFNRLQKNLECAIGCPRSGSRIDDQQCGLNEQIPQKGLYKRSSSKQQYWQKSDETIHLAFRPSGELFPESITIKSYIDQSSTCMEYKLKVSGLFGLSRVGQMASDGRKLMK